MKTAIYVEDGIMQLVLTPETEFEKSSIEPFVQHTLSAKIFEGTFYDCRGGWIRQKHYNTRDNLYGESVNEKSLIIRIDEAQPGENT